MHLPILSVPPDWGVPLLGWHGLVEYRLYLCGGVLKMMWGGFAVVHSSAQTAATCALNFSVMC